jgi:hypothetical protein
VLTKVE